MEDSSIDIQALRSSLSLEPEYITNDYGVRIRKACVSCKFRRAGKNDMTGEVWNSCPVRPMLFPRGYKPIFTPHPMEDSLHKCINWELAPGLENAGKGGGTIKSYDEVRIGFLKYRKLEDERLERFNAEIERLRNKND